jgi:hypothetical protein
LNPRLLKTLQLENLAEIEGCAVVVEGFNVLKQPTVFAKELHDIVQQNCGFAFREVRQKLRAD